MKLLKNRTQIGKALNFGKYPVLSIDMADKDEYGLKGCKVRVDAGVFSDGSPYIVNTTLRVYRDEKKPVLHAEPVGISASFTYSDYKRMADFAQAPIVGPDQDVVIAIYDSNTKTALAPVIVHTAPRVDRHCTIALSFEDADFTAYCDLAGFTD